MRWSVWTFLKTLNVSLLFKFPKHIFKERSSPLLLLFPSASFWWNSLCVHVKSFPLLLCVSLCSHEHGISPIFYFILAILHCFLQSFIVSLFLAILNNFTRVKSDSLHPSDHLITLNSTSPFSEYSFYCKNSPYSPGVFCP